MAYIIIKMALYEPVLIVLATFELYMHSSIIVLAQRFFNVSTLYKNADFSHIW